MCKLVLLAYIPLAVAAFGQAQPKTVAFHRDVAPILDRRCVECHRPKGPAPFSLASYADARRRGRMMLDVIRSGYMPPWLPAAGHAALEGARSVPKEERDVVRRWIDGGMPEGDASDAPGPRRTWPSGWRLGKPDLVVVAPEAIEVPASGEDRFRNLVIPVALDRTRFVAAIEIRPGDPRVVHHGILAIDRTGDARRRDARDEEAGFPGMDLGRAVAPDGHFIGWTPGKGPSVSPAKTAWRLRPGTDLVLQLHLVPGGKPTTIRPEIAFRFTDDPPTRRPYAIVLFSEKIDIPAGNAAHHVTDRFVLPVDVDLLGFYPHAHYLGRDLRAFVTAPGKAARTLFHVPDWDFDWQDEYRLQTPITLPAGSELAFDYTFDNSVDNPRNPHDPPQRIWFGQRSTDEMATCTLMVVPRDPADWIRLDEARWRHRLAKSDREWDSWNALGRVLIEQDRAEEALAVLDRSLRLNPRQADAWSNLSAARLMSGDVRGAREACERALEIDRRHAESWVNLGLAHAEAKNTRAAMAAFRHALDVEPNHAGALANLAIRLAIGGRPQDAIPLLRRAVALDPDRPEIRNNLGNALFSLDRLDEATSAYSDAVRLRPDYFNAWLNLGRVLVRQRKPADARRALEKARALRPDDPVAADALRALDR